MLGEHLAQALTLTNVLLALGGVAAGTIIGSIPGLTATMAVAVLVPLTFTMPPASALILLGAIYTGAIYGGAYSAILLNTPGTPSAIGTTFDGYPMAKRGDGDLAVTLACRASVVGGLVGALFLLTLSPPLPPALTPSPKLAHRRRQSECGQRFSQLALRSALQKTLVLRRTL